jgi:hypothetical protein
MEFSQEEIERIIRGVIDLFLIPKFRELGMPATGEWEDNIEARGNEIWGTPYTQQLVEGRPPGTMPPVESIQKWAAVKLGTSDISVAWAIATKIKNEGTTWYPEGSDLLEVLSTQEVTEYIADQLGRIIVVRIQEEFTQAFA